MWTDKRSNGNLKARPLPLMPLLALLTFLFLCPSAATADPPHARMVVLYPDNADQSLGRAFFSSERATSVALGYMSATGVVHLRPRRPSGMKLAADPRRAAHSVSSRAQRGTFAYGLKGPSLRSG